ncbi:MAG: hypothetical protein ACE5FH_12645, partial [Candidatus Zixiibacteriota bacterium]
GDFIAPFVNLIDVNQPGFQLFQIPRLWGQCGTPQVQAEHMILEPTPWHQAMQLRLVVANVINPGNVNFTISDADNPNGSFNITQPGEYTFDCGAIAPSTSPQWIMIDAGLSGGCFEIDSWALRSTVLDAPPSCCVGTRGDVNGDGNNLDIVDLTCVVDFLFGEGCAMSCMDEADINGDGSAGSDIVDLTCAVDFLFGDPGGCVAACP